MATSIPPSITAAVRKDFAALGKNSVVGDVDRFLGAFVRAVPYLALDERPLHARSNPFARMALTPEV
ncbi:MAG: hypothetical protein JNM17_15270, partial [Archangium sp.]|nr:hypothetical protein [Archangium sp.]